MGGEDVMAEAGKAWRQAVGDTAVGDTATTDTAATDTAHPGAISTAPRTTLELANMLRDAEGRLRCPFGIDLDERSEAGSRSL